jgi:parallel beta-helix repeat protein
MLTRPVVLCASALLLFALPADRDPCLRLSRAGTQVQGDVTVCPGRYRIPDHGELGVLIIAGSGTRLNLTGVTLESGDSVQSAFLGAGVVSRGLDNVEVYGGTIHGFRHGIRIEGGRGHRIARVDVSGSRAQVLRSTPDRYDEADWLDIFRADSAEAYGGGILLKNTNGATVVGVSARRAQNGIGLIDARASYVADNDVSENSGWGIHLWASSHNTLVRNKADHNVRCESPAYRRGCDSAGILLRERSDSNLVTDNNLTWSGDGFFLSGQPEFIRPSNGNLVLRNDGSSAYHNAFESTFSHGNVFLENRADSSDYGFWLGYSTGTTVQGNIILGSRSVGIAIEHGGANRLLTNMVMGGKAGIRLFTRDSAGPASRDYIIDGNIIAEVTRGLVLERTAHARVRGNTFDAVDEALVVDSTGRDAQVTGNVFLRAQRYFIVAPSLRAGSNYWATATEAEAAARVKGSVVVAPWFPASAAGY